jgi:hypothetical protein
MKVNQLIEKHNKSFSTYYHGELYSHTPMALIALRDLGASEKRLCEFYDYGSQKLEPIKLNTKKICDENWKDYFGEYELESSYVEYFRDIVQREGIVKSVSKYFDILMEGVGAAAFHPIIRLSYGVRQGNKDEVAISLATWAASFVNLEVTTDLSEENELKDILKWFQEKNFNLNEKIKADNIATRMLEVSKNKNYKKLCSTIFSSELERDKLEESLLWLYSQTNNFTLLHAVTSHHAFEFLLDSSINKEKSKAYFWKAILAAYLSTTGVVKVDLSWEYPPFDNLPSWEEIKSSAIESNDDHVIKLVHVLNLKCKEHLDGKLRYASALKLNMLKS